MSQFNQGPSGGKNYPQQGSYQQPFNPPPNQSGGGGNTVLIVLSIVGGVLALALICCGGMAYIATSTINTVTTKFGEEFANVLASSMADEVVSKYQDNELVVEKIGKINSYEIEGEKEFALLTKPEIRVKINGEKGEGYIIVYRKAGGSQPKEVVLEVDGQATTIDDKPGPIFSNRRESSNGFEVDFGDGDPSGDDEPLGPAGAVDAESDQAKLP